MLFGAWGRTIAVQHVACPVVNNETSELGQFTSSSERQVFHVSYGSVGRCTAAEVAVSEKPSRNWHGACGASTEKLGGGGMSKILLVDNEPEVIEALRIVLELQGHHMMTALDGWEAFELVSGRLPDVIITDWKMPRVDGLGLCRLLRHNLPARGLPVIMVSAEEPPADRRLQLYDAYLRKPVSIEQLLALVSNLASGRH